MIATQAPELSRLNSISYSSSKQGNTIIEKANVMNDSSYKKNVVYSQLSGDEIKQAPINDNINLKHNNEVTQQIIAHNDVSSPLDLYNKILVRSCSPPSKLFGLQQHQAISASAGNPSNDTIPQTTGTAKVASPLKKIANSSARKPKMMSNLIKRPPVEIEYDTLTYSVTEHNSRRWIGQCRSYKTILKGISGKFCPGELTAIMGPSGAGKSTLMNVLAGYKTSNVMGDININGKTRDLRRFRKMSCYIMQSDDSLSPHLSVGEAMHVAANLKLGSDKSPEAKKMVVNEIVDTLGLEDCYNTRTSMLSGGQRKRLAIALEMVNNPPVMFFDEPTSGLDSSSCLQCISLLKQLAREGRTIVCTIHQPSARILEMFDKLILLSEGQTIYRGTVKGLVPFLSSMGFKCPPFHNPGDFVMEVASGEYGENVIGKLVTAVENGKCNNLGTGGKTSSNLELPMSTVKIRGEPKVSNSIIPPIPPLVENKNESPKVSATVISLDEDEKPFTDDDDILKITSPITKTNDIDLSTHSSTPKDIRIPIPLVVEETFPLEECRIEDKRENVVDLDVTVAISSDSKELKVSTNSVAKIRVEDEENVDTANTAGSSLLSGSTESIDDHCKSFPTSTWTQFRILTKRTFFSIIRDETLTKMRAFSHVAVGLLLGGLYWDVGNEASKVMNNSAMLFFSMLFSMFTAMMPTVMTFPLEMETFKREHLNYWYSMKAYYLAKSFADLPFQIVYPLIYVLIVYFMTSQPLDPVRFGMFALMCILTSLVAQSCGLVIGCACDLNTAVYLGPITTIPILLFSGFFISLQNIPVYMQWCAYVAYVRYGFEGTMLSIYAYDREPLKCSVPYCHFKHPHKFLEELNLQDGVFWIDVVVLIAYFFFFRILGYFVLKFKVKSDA